MSFFEELRRRNVIRVGLAYLVACWLLLQVFDVVGEILSLPEYLGRYVLFLLVAGFIPVVIIAWVYELTPEGLKLESDVDRSQSITPRTGRKLDRLIIAILALAVGLLLFDKLALQPATDEPTAVASVPEPPSTTSRPSGSTDRSVAVLPFAVMSSGPDDDYFADGLTEEIINSLAQLPDLLVTARTSAFHFKGKNIPVDDIAEQLGVAHLVEGSVRRAGDQLRITAQLIRADDGFHLWSETYDRRTEDTFAVQTDIATKVAEALDIFLDDALRIRILNSGTQNVDAFIAQQKGIELYQRAHAEPNQISLLRQANREFAKAVRLEPTLQPAYEYQTDLYTHILMSNASGMVDGDITPEDVEQAPGELRTLLDLTIRHASSPTQLYNAEFSKALVVGPWRGLEVMSARAANAGGCDVALWHQVLAAPFGQSEEILGAFQRMHACDPMLVQSTVHIVAAYLWNGRVDEAIRVGRSALDHTRNPLLVQNTSLAMALGGDPDGARDFVHSSLREDSWSAGIRAQLASIAGEADRAEALHDQQMTQVGPDDRLSLVIAALTGNRNEANRLASLIDNRPVGHMVLLQAVYFCTCGAPFDLEATPNFAGLFAESGFSWPPSEPFKYPLKNW